MDLSLRVNRSLAGSETSPYENNGENYSDRSRQVRAMQETNQRASHEKALKESEARRLYDLQHCKNVNHKRLTESSNELRSLEKSYKTIESQATNLAYIRANDRRRINERLQELQYGAACRNMDDGDIGNQATTEEKRRKERVELGKFYEKQLAEKDAKKYQQYLSLEEERKFVANCAREEERKQLESLQRRLSEKQEWQSVIEDFKKERHKKKEEEAERLKNEELKILAFANLEKERSGAQKDAQMQREKFIDAMRQKLAAQMEEKDRHDKEREQIQNELRQAEDEEAHRAKKRLEKEKKILERHDMLTALKESQNQKTTAEKVKRQEWQDYLDLLKSQADDANTKQLLEDQWRHLRVRDLTKDWDKMIEEREGRRTLEKQKEAEWRNKECQDVKLWRDFVDLEREAFMRKNLPAIQNFVTGYQRFPSKKDNRMVEKLLDESTCANPCNPDPTHHPLADALPPEETQYEVFKNMLHARISEVPGIGSK